MGPDLLPTGFSAAGINAGIKNKKRDLGIIVSDRDCTFWALVSSNKSRAHCVRRTERIREAAHLVQAIIVTSGNANALTGPEGEVDDRAMALSAAEPLGIDPHQVVTASTGVLGARLPMEKIRAGAKRALLELSSDPTHFAESIQTTDRVLKIASREVFIGGDRVRLHAVAKGSGMIAPELATMLCFVTTDAAFTRGALELALESAAEQTFNQLTVDGDMSTNDGLFVLANGAAGNEPIEPQDLGLQIFTKALVELLDEIALAIAKDGEGATRLLKVVVKGAASFADARALSLGVADSLLVKAAVFGADPYVWGRVVASLGAAASYVDAEFELDDLSLDLQSVRVFEKGRAVILPADAGGLKHRMSEPEILIEADLGQGNASAKAYGCDLSYDYVKINADYAAVTTADSDGSVRVDERLAELGPTLKKKLLIEALRYIDRFDQTLAVIKLDGAAMVDPKLEQMFVEDVLLLQEVGLRPVVVHGGGREIARTLEQLGQQGSLQDATSEVVEMVLTGRVNQRLVGALNRHGGKGVGVSGKDGGLIRAKKSAPSRDLGQVSDVESVDPELINRLEAAGYIPVVSPIALGADGMSSFALSADAVASSLACALGAEKLIFLGDLPGLLDGDTLVSEIDDDQLKVRIESGLVPPALVPMLKAALEAIAGGVPSVHLVDARVAHNVIAELFTDRGVGTLIKDH